MTLNLKTLAQIISDMTNSWAGFMGLVPNLPSGDPFLAVNSTVAAQLVDLEANILDTYYYSKAQTCVGPDLDSWMAQFYFLRRPAQQAQGAVQFGMNQVKANAVVIPVNTLVQTVGGAIQYEVIADLTQTSYNATLGGYVIPANQRFCTATVQALLPGTAYNVQPGQLQQLASSSPGVDTVSNLIAIVDGTDPESDPQFNIRFQLYINSLSKATYGSFEEALLSFGDNLKFVILENKDVNGNVLYGNIVTAVDDGSGATPSSTITALAAGLDPIRAFSVSQQVIAATRLVCHIQLALKPMANATTAQIQTMQTVAQTALANYVNSLPINGILYTGYLAKVAIDSSPTAVNCEISSITINGNVVDSITAAQLQVLYADSTTVVVNTY